MKGESKHEHFCFAGQPALCKGYLPNDVLPCVCGAEGDAVTALSQVAVPAWFSGRGNLIEAARDKSRTVASRKKDDDVTECYTSAGRRKRPLQVITTTT
jgi:hypothetical protein